MNENTLLFQNQVEPQQNINEITDKQKMKELVKTNKELEVVLQEHEETIQSLKSKLSDSLKLITFSEQDQLETEQVTKKQQSQIEHLQKELKGVMQEFQEYRQLSKKKREGINALDSKLLQTCVDAMKKAGGFDTQLAQIQKMVYYLESIENKSIQ
jgi:predicted  nucleic acid-binding Zn-ribbon protein